MAMIVNLNCTLYESVLFCQLTLSSQYIEESDYKNGPSLFYVGKSNFNLPAIRYIEIAIITCGVSHSTGYPYETARNHKN
ncbi:hypothetical protein DESC_140038 [Desulfosarcina cetonica]|nr:hypothetical protein DESC_140038 [Desulfosarcina cetonica]